MRGSAAFRTGVAPGGALAGPWVRDPLWRTARTVPSLDLDFAGYKSLVDRVTGQSLVTFTRASSGTFVDSQGVIRTAVTNLLLQSGWAGAVGGSPGTAPTSWSFGSVTGTPTTALATSIYGASDQAVLFSGVTGDRLWYQQSVNVTSGTTYAVTVFCETITGTPGDVIQVVAGTATRTIVSSTASNPASGTRANVIFSATSTGTVIIRFGIGTGTGIAANATAQLSRPQLEQSATVGEYIPTTSTINSAPRFDHNPTTGESLGLLVEESRTNSLLQSEDFSSTWTLSNIAVTTNSVVAPDGTTTADTIAPPADGLTTTRFLRQNPVLTTQQAYTLSVFAKVGTATTNGISLYISDSTATNNFRSNFNLINLTTSSTGTGWATPTATIVPYPNGWYRCILTGVTSTVHVSLRAQIYLNTFGTTPDTYGSIHVWGAQLEAASFPTSYIPTTTATATRSADVASITGANFSSWYRQGEGTVFFEGANPAVSTTAFAVSDGSTSNRLQMDTGTNTRVARVVSGGTTQASNSVAYTYGVSQRFALSYATDSINFANAGVLGTEDASATIPTVDQVRIGANPTGANPLNNTIRRLTYWPQRLPNATLQQITQP